MLATPVCILLTLLAAAPSGLAAKLPSHQGAIAEASSAKSQPGAKLAARASSKKAAPKETTVRKATPRKATVSKAKKASASASKKVERKRAPQKASAKATARKAGPSDLDRARALLRDVKKNPERRRYRHEWEKAILALIRAAKGGDRAPAMLEAARARYALYRFSSDEADRDRALLNAQRAKAAGSREAQDFIAAVRREAGDDRPAQATAQRAKPAEKSSAKAGAATPRSAPGKSSAPADVAAPQGGADEPDEPPDTDPVLDRILAQLAEDPSAAGRLEAVLSSLEGDETGPAPTSATASATAGTGSTSPSPPAGSAAASSGPAAPRSRPDEKVAVAPPPVTSPFPTLGSRAADEEVRGPIRKIVIDPGHGGHDPGAIGPSRVREKDVVLAISKRVARRLRAEGYEVVLTRDRDRYLSLAERTAIANAHQGDLFVSIHANAHPRRDRQGVETWVLDVNSDRYSRRLAARENGIVEDADSPLDVRRILADLDAKVSTSASRRLANVVQQELTAGIRQRVGPVKDLGVKSALFYVLLGARMPAVLVETGFISNRAEEKRLKDGKFQEEVAAGLVRAIDTFAAQQSRIAAR